MTRATCYCCDEPAQFAANYVKNGKPHKGGWASDEVEFQCALHKRYERPLRSMYWNSTFEYSDQFKHIFESKQP